jgi:hypothetical protein
MHIIPYNTTGTPMTILLAVMMADATAVDDLLETAMSINEGNHQRFTNSLLETIYIY